MQTREEVGIGGILVYPPSLDHLELGELGLYLVCRQLESEAVADICAIQDESADALRVANGVCHSYCRAASHSEVPELANAGRVGHRLEVFHELLERELDLLTIG